MKTFSHFFLVLLIWILAANPLYSQGITTVILVRHAEKADTTADTKLSEAGLERAMKLSEMFENVDIDAIYSTSFVRTESTVQPLADEIGVPIQNYDYRNPGLVVPNWLRRHSGETILISGHSNTTPNFANTLMNEQYFEDSFDESDYGNILIVMIDEVGNRKLLHLRY